MSAPAIQTWYDGRRYRSRLEARWACFFRTLGIPFDYETEGYLVGADRVPYLPDFWLPREKVWVEVKGSEENADFELLASAALPEHGLPATGRMVEGCEIRLLILGPFSHRVGRLVDSETGEDFGYCQPAHAILTSRGRDLLQGIAWFTSGGLGVFPEGGLVAREGEGVCWDSYRSEWGNLVGGGASLGETCEEPVAGAYDAARSARFEHGESGAPR